MRRLVLVCLAILQLASAQPSTCSDSTTIQIHITDPAGNPLPGVSGGSAGVHVQGPISGPDGVLTLTRAGRVRVLRKVGYESTPVRIDGRIELSAVMVPSRPTPMFPVCLDAGACTGLRANSAGFCFRLPDAVAPSHDGQDIDYRTRVYRIPNRGAVDGIIHGAGGWWGGPFPLRADESESIEYQEKLYFRPDVPRIDPGDTNAWVIDARGKNAAGTYWRRLGRAGETASYRDVSREIADILDEVLDSVCIR